MIRKISVLLMLLVLGCHAQNPVSTDELNRRVEKRARQMMGVPGYVQARVIGRKDSGYMPGADLITIEFSYQGQKQNVEMLITKDNKTLLPATRMDLTVDPQDEAMSMIDIKGRPIRGAADAKVTMVVFDDYQCPFCSKFHQTVLEVLKDYGDRVKVVYKDFPLYTIHPWAERAAVDSQCLAAQKGEAYWDFVDALHANGKQIAAVSGAENQQKAVDNLAKELGAKHAVDAAKLEACIAQQPKEALHASQAEAEKLKIEGTPAVFINGERLDGAVPADALRQMLDSALANVKAPAKQ